MVRADREVADPPHGFPVMLSVEATGGWRRAAVQAGVSTSGLVEAFGLELVHQESLPDSIVGVARAIDLQRRSRDPVRSQIAPEDLDDTTADEIHRVVREWWCSYWSS